MLYTRFLTYNLEIKVIHHIIIDFATLNSYRIILRKQQITSHNLKSKKSISKHSKKKIQRPTHVFLMILLGILLSGTRHQYFLKYKIFVGIFRNVYLIFDIFETFPWRNVYWAEVGFIWALSNFRFKLKWAIIR